VADILQVKIAIVCATPRFSPDSLLQKKTGVDILSVEIAIVCARYTRHDRSLESGRLACEEEKVNLKQALF
jgi:hypothetical protein